ncbi:MAG: hypothetical protein AAFZ65_16020 [Planctomycetota bacterium]
MRTFTSKTLWTLSIAGLAGSAVALGGGFLPNLQIGADNNNIDNPFIQPGPDPALSGGGRDQSLKFGDVLFGTGDSDVLIGRLGTDVIVGADSDDVLIGGTEHFFPENRDRAFGGPGNDLFLWSPGDGSDFYNGGPGLDAIAFGLMGEINENGELVFQVTNDQQAGNVFIDPATGVPSMDVTNSPGFCEVVSAYDSSDAARNLDSLGLDNLARFFIRGVANAFEAGEQSEDNGLRVTIHLVDVEYVICATREGGQVEVIDLTGPVPTKIRLSQVPIASVASIIK